MISTVQGYIRLYPFEYHQYPKVWIANIQTSEYLPGYLLKTKKKVFVVYAQPEPYSKNIKLVKEWIDKNRVMEREIPSSILSEEMEIDYLKNRIGFVKKNIVSQVFPHGIYYPHINGLEVGSPNSSPESALAEGLSIFKKRIGTIF